MDCKRVTAIRIGPVFSTKKHCTSFEVRCFSFYTDAEKGGSFPQKGKPPPLLIIG